MSWKSITSTLLFAVVSAALALPAECSTSPGPATVSFDYQNQVTSLPAIPDSMVLLFVHLGDIPVPKEISFRIYWGATSPGRAWIPPFGGPLSYRVGWFEEQYPDTSEESICGRVRGIRRALDDGVHFYIPLHLSEFSPGDGAAIWIGYLLATDSSDVVTQLTIGNSVTLGPSVPTPRPLTLNAVAPTSIVARDGSVSFTVRGLGLDQLSSAALVSPTGQYPLVVVPRSIDGTAASLTSVLSRITPGSHALRLTRQDGHVQEGPDIVATQDGLPALAQKGVIFDGETVLPYRASPGKAAAATPCNPFVPIGRARPSIAPTDNVAALPCGASLTNACDSLKTFVSCDSITYVCGNPNPVPNLPCTLWVYTNTNSGYHTHNSPERLALASPPAMVTGNTGPNGTSFRLLHKWPVDAREVATVFVAPLPGCDDRDTLKWCVRDSAGWNSQKPTFDSLPPSGYYERRSGADNVSRHVFPFNLYGRRPLIDSLTTVAMRFRERYPRPPGPLLGYNDMSLPWGGIFDIDNATAWKRPHCWHRNGLVCDVRTSNLDNQNRITLNNLLLNAAFLINRKEKSHFHSWLYGPLGIPPQKQGGDIAFDWIEPADAGIPIVPALGRRPPEPRKLSMTATSRAGQAKTGESAAVQSLTVTVSVTITPNTPSAGFYTYDYMITNTAASQDTVEIFALRGVPLPPTIVDPPHWEGYYRWYNDPTAVAWAVSGEGPPPPGWTDPDSNDVYVGQYALRPGQSASGFRLITKIPPDTIDFFARQRGPIPGDVEQTYPAPNYWAPGASGQILGPGGPITGIEIPPREESGSLRGMLRPPSPNPSTGEVAISFDLDRASEVTLAVYDTGGRLVAVVEKGWRAAGPHTVVWQGMDRDEKRVSAGLYFFQLKLASGTSETQRVAVLR